MPSHGRPATDLADVIRRRGTIYLLGREDPYASASPLMTAVAEHVLDTGLLLANSSPWGGRLCPPLVSVLDELPSTAPLPTLRTRMANERALGLSFIWAAQTRPQLTSIFGEHEARALLGLTNTLVMFGGSKDVAFNQEISDLLGTVRIGRVTHSTGGFNGGGRNFSGDDIPIMRPEEVRQLPERRALVIAENGKPIIAKLHRCVEGKAGERLLADQRALRARLTNDRRMVITPEARATAALVEARRLGFVDDETEPTQGVSCDDRAADPPGGTHARWSSRSPSPGSTSGWPTASSTSPSTAPRSRRRPSATTPCCRGPGSRRPAWTPSCVTTCGSGSRTS